MLVLTFLAQTSASRHSSGSRLRSSRIKLAYRISLTYYSFRILCYFNRCVHQLLSHVLTYRQPTHCFRPPLIDGMSENILQLILVFHFRLLASISCTQVYRHISAKNAFVLTSSFHRFPSSIHSLPQPCSLHVHLLLVRLECHPNSEKEIRLGSPSFRMTIFEGFVSALTHSIRH